MNKKQLAERQKQYEKDSIDFKWFFVIIISALLLTALIENL